MLSIVVENFVENVKCLTGERLFFKMQRDSIYTEFLNDISLYLEEIYKK